MDDEADSFIDDDEDGYSLQCNLERLNNTNPEKTNGRPTSLLSLEEKFSSPGRAMKPSNFSQSKLVRENLLKMEQA